MRAIRELYLNAGFITEDGYIKVNDNLWIASGPYEERTWLGVDKSILPTKEELNKIQLKLQDLILIQESCGLPSLRQMLEDIHSWVWSSTKCHSDTYWIQNMSDGNSYYNYKNYEFWIIPIKRSL